MSRQTLLQISFGAAATLLVGWLGLHFGQIVDLADSHEGFAATVQAIGSIGAIAAAFGVVSWQSAREHRVRDHIRAEVHVGALNAAKAAVTIYDSIVGRSKSDAIDFSRSDACGRLSVSEELITYYMTRDIVDLDIVSVLITTKRLLVRVSSDIQAIPVQADRLKVQFLDEIAAARAQLREGVETMIENGFRKPARSHL